MRVNILNVPVILAICLLLVILAFELGRSIGINQKNKAAVHQPESPKVGKSVK